MNAFAIITIAAWSVRIAHKLFGLIFLWWRKEYRMDRMRIHLSTEQGRQLLYGKTNLAAAIGLLAFAIPVLQVVAVWYLVILGLVFALAYLRDRAGWMVPSRSPKVAALGIAVPVLLALAVRSVPFPVAVTFAAFDLLLFPLTAVLVFLVNLPTVAYHRIVVGRAVSALRRHAPMTVVGITGSFAKTSVKEYLSAILSGGFSTIKTEASKNSPIGIAEVILRSLGKKEEMFVVEMAAYKRGEIRRMCEMVHPEIGIVTAINAQHLDLFGSIETTMRAKYELIQGLSGRRIAIFNADNERVREMGAWARKDGCDVWWYTLGAPLPQKTFRASQVRSDISGVHFTCHLGDMSVPVHAEVLGAHQVGNILAAIAGAVACGLPLKKAAAFASRIEAADKVMRRIPGINGSVFIDDTFNNNPDAARAAIEFIGSQNGKKILVFQPMIELGSDAESAHRMVGELAAGKMDAVFLTNANHFRAFEEGVRRISKTMTLEVAAPSRIASYIRTHAGKDSIVLFKGKDAEHALHLLGPSRI